MTLYHDISMLLDEAQQEKRRQEEMESKFEKINSATFKANFTEIVDRVRLEGKPVIVARNNRELVAVVPLDALKRQAKQR